MTVGSTESDVGFMGFVILFPVNGFFLFLSLFGMMGYESVDLNRYPFQVLLGAIGLGVSCVISGVEAVMALELMDRLCGQVSSESEESVDVSLVLSLISFILFLIHFSCILGWVVSVVSSSDMRPFLVLSIAGMPIVVPLVLGLSVLECAVSWRLIRLIARSVRWLRQT